MSTTTEASTGTPGSAFDRMPFTRIFRTELRKLVDTRTSRALLAATFVLTPAVVVVSLFVVDHNDLNYDDLVNYSQTPQKVLLPALAILTITSEWSQRTALTTFTLVPDRPRILAAKLTSIVLLGLGSTLLIFGWAAVGMAVAPATGASLDWNYGPSEAVSMFVIQMTGALEGAGIGMLILSSAGAVIAFYVVPNLWSVLLNGLGWQAHAPWVDINQALGNLYDHEVGATQALQVLTAAALWVLLPVAVGTWRVVRAEPQ